MKNSKILTLCIWAFIPIFFSILVSFVISLTGIDGTSDMNKINYVFSTILSGAGLLCVVCTWLFLASWARFGKYIDNLEGATQKQLEKALELGRIIKEYNNLIIKSFPKPEYTKEQKEMINDFISTFKYYFEGFDAAGVDPIYTFSIMKFGITNIGYEFSDDKFIVTITLERPGFLIGKGGSVIDALSKYLNEHFKRPVEIKIIESSVWTRIK